MKSIKNQSGFTLIEILVVLIVIGIISSLFTLSYFRFQATQRVRGAIRVVMEMKKAMNDLESECKGMPLRGDISDEANFLQLIDKQECDAGNDAKDSLMLIWRMDVSESSSACEGTSMGKQMGLEGTGGRNAFCKPSCEYGSKSCGTSAGIASNELFTEVQGDPCTPSFPAIGGSPGWNYNLLTGAPTDKPVGVICAIAVGYKTPVKIVINTGGYYMGTAVTDGTGVYGINGTALPNRCPCGPWCENMATGEKGCCNACFDQPGIGYRF